MICAFKKVSKMQKTTHSCGIFPMNGQKVRAQVCLFSFYFTFLLKWSSWKWRVCWGLDSEGKDLLYRYKYLNVDSQHVEGWGRCVQWACWPLFYSVLPISLSIPPSFTQISHSLLTIWECVWHYNEKNLMLALCFKTLKENISKSR